MAARPPDRGLLRSRQELSFRLAGKTPPAVEDKETTIAEIRQRIKTTLELLKSIDSTAMDGAEDREIVLPAGPKKMKMQGANYLLHFALPNFYFHLTTAYDILRSAGVEIGKLSFLGAVPGLVMVWISSRKKRS